MDKRKKRFVITYINLVMVFLLFIFRASGLLTLQIGSISPILLLPLVVSVSMFFGEWYGASIGFLSGLLMDSSSLGSSLFNTFGIMLIGLLCGIAANFYLNKNIKSAIALSGAASFGYYLAKFLFLYVFKGGAADGKLFAEFLLPSVIYTAIFIIPFYFLEKKLKNL